MRAGLPAHAQSGLAVTDPSRVGKLIALASEINDVEVDAGSLAFMGQVLVQTVLIQLSQTSP